jgi:SAM-dependent methyltransferase
MPRPASEAGRIGAVPRVRAGKSGKRSTIDEHGKTLLTRALYRARDVRSRPLFAALQRYCSGRVLDVGGWDFVQTAQRQRVPFDQWVTVERDATRLLPVSDARVGMVYGDGCELGIATARFDTVLNVQVLEHVFEPIRMVEEVARVLKPGGHAIFLIPTTSTMHLAPHFHSNFSRFWVVEAMRRAGLEIVQLSALGGIWSSMASHLVYFFLQAARTPGMSDPAIRRPRAFWVLLPLQAVYAAVSIPICMLLSLGDLQEEPNNHLVVARKPGV